MIISFECFQTLCDCEEILRQHDARNLKDSIPAHILNCIQKFLVDFENSISDDLHTPVVLAGLSEPLKTINDLLHTRKVKEIYTIP